MANHGANRISARLAMASARGLGRRDACQGAGDFVESDGAGDLAEQLVAEVQTDAGLMPQAFAVAGAQPADQLADLARGIQAVAGEQQAATAIDELEVELASLAVLFE